MAAKKAGLTAPAMHMLAYSERIELAKQFLPAVVGLSPVSGRAFASPSKRAPSREFERLMMRLLFSELQSLGLFIEAQPSLEVWKSRAPLAKMYERWLEQSVRLLTDEGYLRIDSGVLHVTDPSVLERSVLWAQWDACKSEWRAEESLRAQVSLVEETLRALGEILTGRRPATEVVFPNSSLERVQGIYKHNPVADYFNGVLADGVVEFVQGRLRQDAGARIRILEIGAGTGGTSEAVFEPLKAWSGSMGEYCYTDISKAFLVHAQGTYGGRIPYLTSRLFNVEEALEGQGIEVGAYDVVIATNVLHATRDIRQTLRNAKAVLKGRGVLLLNELSKVSVFAHLTFGLLEGWWLYEDGALRIPGTPALSPETWRRVLRAEGFAEPLFPASAAHTHGQQIIVAHSDGMIRQRIAKPKPSDADRSSKVTEDRRRARPVAARSPSNAELPAQATSAQLKQTIIERLSESLKVPQDAIDPDESFADYGLDSIMGVQTTRSIAESLGIELQTTSLFDYPSVTKLASYILSQHASVIATKFGSARSSSTAEVSAQASLGQLKQTIIERLSESLKVPEDAIDPDESFADYGLDSIMGVQTTRSIAESLGIELQTTSLFDYPSVTKLASYILLQHPFVVAAKFVVADPVETAASIQMSDRGSTIFSDPVSIRKPEQSLDPRQVPVTSTRTRSRRIFGRSSAPLVQDAAIAPVVAQRGNERPHREPIAIIGMSGRYPLSDTVNQLWEHLAQGRDLTDEVSRWTVPQRSNENGAAGRRGGLLTDIDRFDPMFFNISGIEATYMDPQQRLFLEESWHALEDAGYAGSTIGGRRCGVYVGCAAGDYSKLFEREVPAQAFWGNVGSITAARISYYLDLQGPAIAVDTACSSSLVAVHLACQGLWGGETELALAGGVVVHSTPGFFAASNNADMLSPTGRCNTFDDSADGFVPGEGVGVVVLKRLSDALADGDHIHGVIRGIGINQDGTTNGITAPSAVSQERLECQVYETFKIRPEEIQLVEAHGTGTKLGDPIEFRALTQAFRRDTDKKNYCAIGSIKTNIGHALMAAGVAGVIKVLLALKHRQIPPSLNFRKGNSHIDFENSPFFVNTALRAWEVEVGRKRCAAVSSFGFSGTNAHLVIEEAPLAERTHRREPAYLIVLSASTAGQLEEHVGRLMRHCEDDPTIDGGNVGYTLMLGRKHLSHRLACVAASVEELTTLLKQWLEKGRAVNVYTAVLSEKEVEERVSLLRYGNQCIEECREGADDYLERLAVVADLYAQGYRLSFERLFLGDQYSRISLPTYPFARERYWVAPPGALESGRDAQGRASVSASAQHPLLQTNTSTLSEQRFSTELSGAEFFLRDHVVSGVKVLPGVCYLEMARAAVVVSAVGGGAGMAKLRLKSMVWQSPIVVEASRRVHIGLQADDRGGIEYEVYTDAAVDEGAEPARVIHAQGRAVVSEAGGTEEPLDLDGLRAGCHERLDASRCYAAWRARGIEYGASHRALQSVSLGRDSCGARYALAALKVPEIESETGDGYVLHPSMLDSALQASIGWSLEESTPREEGWNKPLLPFALEELEILARSPAHGYAYLRAREHTSDSAPSRKLDVDICDEQGRICVRLKGLTSRPLEGSLSLKSAREFKRGRAVGSVEVSSGAEVARAVLQEQELTQGRPGSSSASAVHWLPCWDVVSGAQGEAWPSRDARVLLVGGTVEHRRALGARYGHLQCIELSGTESIAELVERIGAHGVVEHVLWFTPMGGVWPLSDERLIRDQATGVLSGLRLIKALLQLGYESRALGWTALTWQTQRIEADEAIAVTHSSIAGLVGSLAKEYGHWQVRLIDVPLSGECPLEELLRVPADPHGDACAYRSGEWYRQQLVPCELPAVSEVPYRRGGVYVVIGGAGGLGEVLSEHLIRTYQAQMVWIGRRGLDATIQGKLDRLGALGPAPMYVSADAADRGSLEGAYRRILARHGEVHGVVHAAIALLDKSLAQMDEDRFKAALSAKVDVSVRLGQVFGQGPLEWVLFFSSLQSFSKAGGQSNYAAGCTFKDGFAQQLSRVLSCPVKVMNWGYWGSIGIVASSSYRARMARQGIGSIEPEEGMAALERLLCAPVNQAVFMKTTPPGAVAGSERNAPVTERVPAAHLLAPSERIELAKQFLPAVVGLSPVSGRAFASPSKRAPSREFERLMMRLLFSELQSLGLFIEAQPSLEVWKSRAPLSKMYERWLEQSVRLLTEEGYLRTESGVLHVNDPSVLERSTLWAQWDACKSEWRAEESLRAQVSLVEETLRALGEILTGRRPATEVVFPNSSLERVQGIYKHNPIADYFNGVLADGVVEFVQGRLRQDAGARIRILEIGAGTGGTSEAVFEPLKAWSGSMGEYCYTDISKAFLVHAQGTYGGRIPYLTSRLFNVEEALEGQGIEVGAYDVVIATNVLHATRDIRQTLRNAKAVLKGRGVLLLNELSKVSVFAHLTFGLLEGWWLYEDGALRTPGTPALSPETWRRVLRAEGFAEPLFPASAAHTHGQQIIVAHSDGVIRQTSQFSSTVAMARHVLGNATTVARGPAHAARPTTTNVEPGQLRERAVAALRRLVSETLLTPLDQIHAHEPFERYGIDSILVVKMTNALSRFVPDISSTLFFEHGTIAMLADHLLRSHRVDVARWTGVEEVPARPPATLDGPEIRRFKASTRRYEGSATVRAEPARAKSKDEPPKRPDIAIIGLSGRYPLADSVHELWENLKVGRNCIREIPAERWDHGVHFDPQRGKAGKAYSKWGGFIDDVDRFDPLFFRISPLEAEQMDPQERLFLQEAYASIEDAGYTPASLCSGGVVGVYAGVMNSTYFKHSSYWSIANRISYLFGFNGPSMAVDTACSSSLTAIHLAVESIQNGTCDHAIAGGVNLIIDPVQYTNLAAMGLLSSDDKCRAFGDRADGMVDGEGVGVVLLKAMKKAVADGDHIYGVIKATSINHGGKTHGYTVPNPAAQRDLVLAALGRAGIDPRTISYVEAHGTGTELGDPIEITGLSQAFERYTQDKQYCAIGSVKSNIGHLESAAGISGLTKVLLQMQHRTLVPSLHAEVLNPHIDFARTPFRVQQAASEWSRPVLEIDGVRREYPRIAGISSFGAGGSNAHVIVEEYRGPTDASSPAIAFTSERPALIVLSAKNEERLRALVRRLLAHFESYPYAESDLADLAYTLQVGREAMDQRLAFTVTTLADLKQTLRGYVEGKAETGVLEKVFLGDVKKSRDTVASLDPDDAANLIQTWLEKRNYTKLLSLWVRGLSFDWAQLYAEGGCYGPVTPRRLSLPTYPFARERYWAERTAQAPGVSAPTSPDDITDCWMFAENWQLSTLPAAAAESEARTIVALISDPQRQAELSAAVAQLNGHAQVVFVSQITSAEPTALRYAIAREDAESYAQAFERIVERHGRIDAVWCFRALEDARCIRDQQPIFQLIRGLSIAGIRKTAVLLAGEHESPLDRCYLESWIGYERSLKQVLPDVQLAVIHGQKDARAEAAVPSDLTARWACRLWRELNATKIESALYVGESRHVLRVRPVAVPSPSAAVLRAGGTYLITGGFGGLGYLFAEYLAKRYAACLVIVGRSCIDASKEARLRALETLGGSAIYVAADVTDPRQVRAALERARERFGPVHGVVHAAGVQSDGTVLDKDMARVEAVLAPKIVGTLALEEACRDLSLDFICYFSSSSAVLGDFGACDYAVGSRFELAHAKYVADRAIAICWPLWADGGMRMKDEAAARLYLKSSGQRALRAAEGIELFEQALALRASRGASHALVVVGQKSAMDRMLGLAGEARVESIAPPSILERRRRAESQGLTVAQCVLWELQEMAAELLKLPREKLDAEENLAEFGIDSIGLAKLARRLSDRFGVDVTPAIFFSHSSLSKVSAHLLGAHPEIMDRHYRMESAALHPRVGSDRDATEQERHSSPTTVERRATTDTQARVASDRATVEPIAIVGMSGRFPGARNVDELWQILASGQEAVREIPLERFDWGEPYQTRKIHGKWLGAVPGVDEFDPVFFEISPREAQSMDPRQRLLLQESYNALEDAGCGSLQLSRPKIGVFVGVEQGEYATVLAESGAEGNATANHDAILAARLSYFLNLHGPAMAINTACSSGLVAAHQAAASVRSGECEMAIAAGVSLTLTTQSYVTMSQAGMLSMDGKSYAFDKRANGMVPGEAVVAIVVKRLSQAEEDGDKIYAVIRGSGINHDGKTNGLTAPNGDAQAELIEDVYRRAGISPSGIEYIVTHGTGTRLGDPVEIEALRRAFKDVPQGEPYCALTSTKTNLGHTFAASGLVSLVSLVQAMRHETIPASLHCEQLSDYIDWKRSPFYVNIRNKAWARKSRAPRLGAVSAFGISGTNAHMVVEGYDEPTRETAPLPKAPCFLFVLSAKTEAALAQRAGQLIGILQDEHRDWSSSALAALSHTLLVHRQHFAHRCAFVGADREQVKMLLERIATGEKHPGLVRGTASREFVEQPVFKQHGRELLERLSRQQGEPQVYRESLLALGDLYCRGYSMPWEVQFGDHLPRRMSLPFYPFARERYWVRRARPTAPAAQADGRWSRSAAPRASEPVGEATSAAAATPRAARKGSAEPTEVRAAELVESLAKALYMEVPDVEREKPFSEMGLDSILGVEWVRVVNARYGLSLAATKIYDYPTINALAGFIVQEQCRVEASSGVVDSGEHAVVVDAPRPMISLRALTDDAGGGEPPVAATEEPAGYRSDATSPVNGRANASVGTSGAYPHASNLNGHGLRRTQATTDGERPPTLPVALRALVRATPLRAARERSTEATEALAAELAGSLAEALYMEVADVDREKPFSEMGLDSILGVEWMRALNARYGLSLVATKIYDFPTIDALTRFILQEQGAQGSVSGAADSPELDAVGVESSPPRIMLGALTNDGERGEGPRAPTGGSAGRRTAATYCTPIGAVRTAAHDKHAIAIVGTSGRYPHASNLDEYWENLAAGRDCVEEIPSSRWNVDEHYDSRPQQPGKIYCKSLGRLEGIECFDPLFFGISPAEAQRMDPQHRLFLEESYKAFEDAGYDPKRLSNARCGVYLGIMGSEYLSLLRRHGESSDSTGNSAAIAAARIAYCLNLKGPAIAIDTACSGSLVATHLGCQALRTGEIDMALVGGVSLYLTPESYVAMCAAGMLSPQGRCKTFDNEANGFVPGEGVGTLVLKRLRDAQAAGDRIYGVIIGSGINQDGKTNGITAPSAASQMELEREVYSRYGIHPESISYAEMHGTGTKLGDPIELDALSTVFKEQTSKRNFCALGSVKSNIGHTSAAAGVASVQKVLLSLQHGELAPTLNYVTPNEHFDFAQSPFFVNTERRPWKREGLQPRRATVSSFGYSGTNAHLVIEDYLPPAVDKGESVARASEAGPVIVLCSAKTLEQLRESARRLKVFLDRGSDVPLADLAYTTQIGREAMQHRLAIVVDSKEQLARKLQGYADGQFAEGVYAGQVKNANDAVALLGSDEDVRTLLQTWVRKQKLSKLAELWVKGGDIDWAQLQGTQPRRRIGLPTYPFAKERYWIPEPPQSPRQEEPARHSSVVRREPDHESATSPEDTGVERAARILTKRWELSPVAWSPRAPNHAVIVCRRETRATAERLSTQLPASRVLILDGEASTQPADMDWGRCEGWIDVVGCGSTVVHDVEWIALLQRWIEHGPTAGMVALCVTRGLEAWKNSAINLAGADRVGLYRMLSSEYSKIRACHVDVDATCDEPTLIERVVAECGGPRAEIEVCHRAGQRYRAVLQEERPADGVVTAFSFRSDRVLWITGGTRGIGYVCAQHFVREHAVKRLVLSGRETFPPPEEWEGAKREDSALGRKIRAVLALESQGAQVQVLSVSLTDERAVQQSIERVKETLGPIGGVLHCAGTVDSEPRGLIRKSTSGIRAVSAPKVRGLDHLVKCFAGEPLQFFLLFSSVSAAVPSLAVGQSDYAMANAYMDYVAQAHAEKLPITSIQWPNWRDSGMGENRSAVYRQSGFLSHTDSEGVRLLDGVLTRRYGALVMPALVDPARLQVATLLQPRSKDRSRESSPAPAAAGAIDQRGVSEESLAAVQAQMIELVARELKIDRSKIEIDTPLPNYGVDSIVLVQLLRPIAERVGVPLDPSILFEYPTIELFSKWLTTRYADVFAPQVKPLEARAPAIPAASQVSAERLSTVDRPRCGPEDIAVVGLSCRFAGANTLEDYWRLLAEGRTAIGRIPRQRWGHASDYNAAVLQNATQFDPEFFLISQADARAMDPQALLALEESLALWYHGGYTPQEIQGCSIGVYLGARAQIVADTDALDGAQNPIMAVGANYLAANISRFFDLRGPSVVIDTACSSALVAMNMAIQSLHSGEIESALVGGVSLLSGDAALRMFEQRGILSRDAALHLLDGRAQGTVLGEGAGMVWLKSVERALHDGDCIYGVVKGIAINNNGRTAGPTAPNMQSQKAVMRRALDRSGKQPEDIGYIEVNGSGSEVTDLLELKAIESVYRSAGGNTCELGSMKPSIGHPLCAEGIASFIKSVLMLHRRQRVPFLSAREPMRHYDLASSPFRFSRALSAPGDVPEVIGINCFADGGTNAHVIVERWRNEHTKAERRPIAPPSLRRVECRASTQKPERPAPMAVQSIWGQLVSSETSHLTNGRRR